MICFLGTTYISANFWASISDIWWDISKVNFWPTSGDYWIVRGSSNSAEFTLGFRDGQYVPNIMAIYPVVEIFQYGRKWWKDQTAKWETDIAMPRATSLALLKHVFVDPVSGLHYKTIATKVHMQTALYKNTVYSMGIVFEVNTVSKILCIAILVLNLWTSSTVLLTERKLEKNLFILLLSNIQIILRKLFWTGNVLFFLVK